MKKKKITQVFERAVITGGDNFTSYVDVVDGQAVLKNILNEGEYDVVATYMGDNKFNSNITTEEFNVTLPVVVKTGTVLTAAKVTATYDVAKNLVITLKDSNGKVLAGKKVTVKLGSITKTLTTDDKGQISVNVANLVPNTYTATFEFAGDSSYIASGSTAKVVVKKAKSKITAKKKTFKAKKKTKKYKITLKANNKAIKKVKVTIKVGKKTYKAKTNAKGKATFKIKKLTKKGKYTAKIKFKGNKYYNAVTKKVKIKIK